jgi:hypothetical protein
MGRWKSFQEALLRPSTAATLIAIAVAFTTIVACGALIDERLVGSGTGRDLLPFGRSDDDLEVTSRVLELRRRDDGRPIVIVLGASETREIIDRPRLESQLTGSDGTAPELLMLTQARQGLSEVVRLVEEIPDGTRGVLVLSLGVGRFVVGDDDAGNELIWPRLGFRTERRDAELRAAGQSPPSPTGIFLVDNLRFYFPRLLALPRNLLLGPPVRRIHRYDDRPAMSAEEWQSRADFTRQRLAEFDANFTANAELLTRALEALRARTRMTVVVTSLPVNPRFVDEVIGDERYRAMIARMFAMVEGWNVELVDLSAARLAVEDYWDWIHLRIPAARARTTDLLAPAGLRGLAAAKERP